MSSREERLRALVETGVALVETGVALTSELSLDTVLQRLSRRRP